MLFGVTIFLSAFLLFQVELISAKQLLPWYGGTPSVWTTSQVFFQVVLLGGYAYAHLLSKAAPRLQGRIHLGLLAASLAVVVSLALWGGVPILAPQGLKPNGSEAPAPLVFLTLSLSVGLPFLVLSSTGPLIQHWHSRTAMSAHQTYRLYALSNAGSLLGLLAYPLVVERLLPLSDQAWLWSALFVAFALSCGRIAAGARTPALPPKAESPEEPRRSGKWVCGLWLALSFSSSAMFLATTNQLCQEVAVVPFLWALPLGVYLVTFIICFEKPSWYSRAGCSALAAVVTIAVLSRSLVPSLPVLEQVVGYGALLGLFCMICNGELVKYRPGPSGLTLYYLVIAAGGALGGAFVSLAAPVLFEGLWEFHVMVLLGWIVFAVAWALDRTSPLYVGSRSFLVAGLVLIGFLVAPRLLVAAHMGSIGWIGSHPLMAVVGTAAGLAAFVSWGVWRAPSARSNLLPRGLVALVLAAAATFLVGRIRLSRLDTVFAARNFFGVVRVVAMKDAYGEVRAYKMIHGITNHGLQIKDPTLDRLPTTYYAPGSGVGYAARFVESRSSPWGTLLRAPVNIGVLGMGAGTLSAYARPGDHLRFYEIDPIVIAASSGSDPYFTFVRDCRGDVTIAPGDARLVLERELKTEGSRKFDLLVLDAFSGDAIPVHLLTEEAFRVYRDHLKSDASILAVHITNAHLELEPVIAASARRLGFEGVRIDYEGDKAHLPEPSTWILLSREKGVFERGQFKAAAPRPLGRQEVLFTDQFSNLLRVLK